MHKWADKTKVLPQGGCRGVGYEQQCLLCLEEGKVALYHGETCRTLYTRSREHANGLKKHKTDNPMHKHICNHHFVPKPQLLNKSNKVFSDPLTRQINIGVIINHLKSS